MELFVCVIELLERPLKEREGSCWVNEAMLMRKLGERSGGRQRGRWERGCNQEESGRQWLAVG